MSSEGRGGFWNRSGRRSGGYRPTEIIVPAATVQRAINTLVKCPACGFDMLPLWVRPGCACCMLVRRLDKAINNDDKDLAMELIEELMPYLPDEPNE